MTLEETLSLPESILEFAVGSEIQRLTLLGKLKRSPTSSSTRMWISNSSKYGLTKGSYTAKSLQVTEAGQEILNEDLSVQSVKKRKYELAIRQFNPFKELYDKLEGKPLPDEELLSDEFELVGVSKNDCRKAAGIFEANLRFVGLVREIGGKECVTSVDEFSEPSDLPEVLEDASDSEPAKIGPSPVDLPRNQNIEPTVSDFPLVHINVQVHIDSSAASDQIDQIFASMAKHIYGRTD